MTEPTFYLAAAVFLFAACFTMVRLGAGRGGRYWAGAWACVLLYGLVNPFTRSHPVLDAPALEIVGPALATATAALLFAGTLRFTQRAPRLPNQFWYAAIAVGATRVALYPTLGPLLDRIIGSVLIVTSVAASAWVLLNPKDRPSTIWERAIGLSFPTIAIASGLNTSSRYLGEPVGPALLFWLGAGIVLCTFKVSAFISLTTAPIKKLRKEAEHSREVSERMQAQYREVTEQASDMIAELDEHGICLYANPAFDTILGHKPESLIGVDIREVLAIDVSMLEAAWTDAAESVTDPTLQRTILAPHANGRALTLECNIRRFNRAGGASRYVVMIRDITQRAADERARERDRRELVALVDERTDDLRSSRHALENAQRLAAMGTMTAGIGHQIKNPVSAIQIASEFALSTPPDHPDADALVRTALEDNLEQARQCGRVVSNMLRFARNETTPKTREDLWVILRQVCAQTVPYLSDRKARLELNGISGEVPIWASAIELEQALVNLLRNAAESSEGPVRITLRARQSNERVWLSISDDGRGMSPDEIERIFDPFFTTRLDHGGTGLGLSVAQGIVQNHSGGLVFESVPGEGTSVTLSLPIHREEA